MRFALSNPVAFTPLPVTIITAFVYAALIVSLLIGHLTVPEAPDQVEGLDLTEAWRDLQTLTNGFHPYNSVRNDEVRNWLLSRVSSLLQKNQALSPAFVPFTKNLTTNGTHGVYGEKYPVVVFNDMVSNLSFTSKTSTTDGKAGFSIYFEGTNIIVYIRGSEDDPSDWFLTGDKFEGKGGVLVSAHYDSVSTGFGATDNGVGVVSVLQLIKYFSAEGRQPKKGIVALLNNGEEDGLHGAWAFAEHPMSKFPHTFLNLDGAGAGGRALLFRTTDTEVTRAYQQSPHPFGTAISADAFRSGLIRSDTDYSVFAGVLGMRGLDVAFLEPRSRYHTNQDDTKHTSKASLYHMLSASLASMKELSGDTSSTFDGKKADGKSMPNGKGSNGVWFDLFGAAFTVFRLDTLFALSVTLLVLAPVTLIAIGAILYKVDRFYLFSYSKHHHSTEGDDSVGLQGWRGFSRWPIAFVFATASVIGLAFLLTSINPYIINSSPYAIWSMMISAWIFVAWVCLCIADSLRPTALQRAYVMFWMFIAGWIILVVTTVFEKAAKFAGGYLVFFYFACIYLATTITLLEPFGLPRKSDYAEEIQGHTGATVIQPGSVSDSQMLAPSAEERGGEDDTVIDEDQEDADERTSLLGGGRQTTFKRYSSPHRRAEATAEHDEKPVRKVYGFEQPWSHSLPSSLWLFSFFLLAPFPLIIVGQVSLLGTSAMYQTLADGNDPLTVYLALAIFSALLFAPLGPFLHRYTYHLPAFLFLIFIGTLIYNLIAFPFSANNQLKLFFLQQVDLDTGLNNVSLTGIGSPPYLRETISSLPSATGQEIKCIDSPRRRDLTECSWPGLPPRVVRNTHLNNSTHFGYEDWFSFNVTRSSDGSPSAHFHILGHKTRACRILFNRPISDFHIDGSHTDKRFKRVGGNGSKELRLWSRTWEREWEVDVKWDGDGDGEGLDGRVVCLWSDGNVKGVIPALDEVKRFCPAWVAVTKTGDGLVEGSKAFLV